MSKRAGKAVLGAIGGVAGPHSRRAGSRCPDRFPLPNGSGFLETRNAGGAPIDLTGPFFQSLGTNGRSCGTCHRPAQGWGISANEVKIRFLLSRGMDPIFRTNDGSNCDHNIDTSDIQGRRQCI